jgi:hypothetical protein
MLDLTMEIAEKLGSPFLIICQAKEAGKCRLVKCEPN